MQSIAGLRRTHLLILVAFEKNNTATLVSRRQVFAIVAELHGRDDVGWDISKRQVKPAGCKICIRR